MNKIRVIDLLNKIANGEDIPKKIRYQAGSHKKDLYTYNEYAGDYEREIGLNLFVYLFMKERITGFLNNEVEVEIIEEDKKIEKLERFIPQRESDTYCTKYNEVADKINEIIDKLNKEE